MTDLKKMLRAAIRDDPVWVETRDLLASPASQACGNLGAFVIWNPPDEFGAVVGRPGGAAIAMAARECIELLAFAENIEAVREALPAWSHVRVTILSQADLAPHESSHPTEKIPRAEISMLAIEGELRSEVQDAADDEKEIFAAFEANRPVAFAYAASETESLFDVAIDTLPTHRRRGFAQAAANRLINEMAARGKAAVWGAADNNPGSYHLARSLGFEPIDFSYVLSPPND